MKILLPTSSLLPMKILLPNCSLPRSNSLLRTNSLPCSNSLPQMKILLQTSSLPQMKILLPTSFLQSLRTKNFRLKRYLRHYSRRPCCRRTPLRPPTRSNTPKPLIFLKIFLSCPAPMNKILNIFYHFLPISSILSQTILPKQTQKTRRAFPPDRLS